MKDIRQCSISSIAFTLEIDAYDTLSHYIESIKLRYTDNPDGVEILADIEARIAELILAVHSADRVVAKPLIDNIIKQMGSVDDICADAPASESEQESTTSEPKPKSRRHLYRNIDDAPIGGVCSGIAAFIGCNTAVVRIVALLLLFFGGASIWIYVILWIVTPAAITARQKLEMRGEPITVSSIRDYYNVSEVSSASRSIFSSLLSGVGKLLMIVLKFIVACITIALIISIFGLIILLFAVIFASTSIAGTIEPIMLVASIVVLVGLGIYALVQLLNSRKIKIWPVVAALLLWIALSLSAAAIVSFKSGGIRDRIGKHISEITRNTDISINVTEQDDDYIEFEIDYRLNDEMETLKRLQDNHRP